MSLSLKIEVMEQSTTKVLRFAETMSVHEAGKTIMEKVGIGGRDHGLFQPFIEGENSSNVTGCGRWLRPDRTIQFYDLKTNDQVQYKKKTDVIKVKLDDNSIKSVNVDLSLPVTDVVQIIGARIGLKNSDEFSLQSEANPGQWLKPQQSIPEQVRSTSELFLFCKKFFMDDANVDQDDPIRLHLIYCRCRSDVVSGTYPVQREEAIQFASLQCQIQNGDFRADSHGRSGFLNMTDYLSPEWAKKGDMEKIICGEWKKLVGMTETNARYRYVQLCRQLKTYGMTIYRVKERATGKKNKLMESLLCFTRDSVLRMELETKKIISEHPFKHLLRWAATPETFTLDFGAYEDEYIVLVTNNGEEISALIAGYIDLLLKKQRDAVVTLEDDGAELAQVTSVQKFGGQAQSSSTTTTVVGNTSAAQAVNDLNSGIKAMDKMANDMFGEIAATLDNNLTPLQRRQQMERDAKNLGALAGELDNVAKSGDKAAMNAQVHKLAAQLEQLILASRQAVAAGADPSKAMLDAAKGVNQALRNLLQATQEYQAKPNDPAAQAALLKSQNIAQAAIQKLIGAAKGTVADEGMQQLLNELARAVAAEADELANEARDGEGLVQDGVKKVQLEAAVKALGDARDGFAAISAIVTPTAQDVASRNLIHKAGKGLETAAAFVVSSAKASGFSPDDNARLADGYKRLGNALGNLLSATELPTLQGAKEAEEFIEGANTLLQATAAMMAAANNPDVLKQQAQEIKGAATKIGNAGKGLVGSTSDPKHRERLANYLKGVVEGTKNLLSVVPVAIQNPSEPNARAVQDAAGQLAEATQDLLGDSGRRVAVAALFNAAKAAAAQTAKLQSAAAYATGNVDPQTAAQLQDASVAAGQGVQKLVGALKNANQAVAAEPSKNDPFSKGNPNAKSVATLINDELMAAAENFAPAGYKLVSQAKNASSKVNNPDIKNDLMFSSNNCAKAIQRLLEKRTAMKEVKAQLEAIEAIEAFKGAVADLESAFLSADLGNLPKTKTRDDALQALAAGIKELTESTKNLAGTSKNAPEDLGQAMKRTAAAMSQVVGATTALAAALDDKLLQKGLLNAVKGLAGQLQTMMQVCKAVSTSPEDPNLNKLLLGSGKNVAEAIAKLAEVSKGVVPKKVEELMTKSSGDIESLAEQELAGAAAAIERCVHKLNAAKEEAQRRAAEKSIAIEEQTITEAILVAAQAIAKATGVLMNAATDVQKEFNKMVKEPKTGNVYRRDPQWAEGLISAAKTVAGAVQHLVAASDAAARGNASEDTLCVAAQAVSAATTQLVTASTVKGNPNSDSQRRLKDASSRVTQATNQLVDAARNAAAFEHEQEEDEDAKYNLTEDKIQQMEQQMKIIRMERELEKARSHLGKMRKDQYVDAKSPAPTNAPPPKGPPQKVSGAPPPRGVSPKIAANQAKIQPNASPQ